MASQYFRVIETMTSGPDETNIKICRARHEQKLNNYMTYGQPFIDADIPLNSTPLPKERAKEVESQSTSIALTDHRYIIITTLCCENEYEERTEG